MSEKRERTAQEVLDAIARTEAEYQEIERFAKMSDEDVAKILAEHGVTPEEARGAVRKAAQATVTPIRRRSFAVALLVAATFAAAAIGGGVLLARNDEANDHPVAAPLEASTEADAGADR